MMKSVYDTYPDDDTIKKVYLPAAGLEYAGFGDRHVLIWWSNDHNAPSAGAEDPEQAESIIQIIQLTGGIGCYAYYAPVAQAFSLQTFKNNLQLELREFTREQKDRILEIANATKFVKNLNVNGCRVWTRDLLGTMVEEGLITQELFEKVDKEVPLVKRVPEAGR